MTTGRFAAHTRADAGIAGAAFVILLAGIACVGTDLYTDHLVRFAAVVASVTEDQSPLEAAAAKMADERQCLAEALYYEARGEGKDGQKAVAEVVLTRVQSRYFPSTICGVVHEGAEQPGKHCQFSYACDGSLKRPKDTVAWRHSVDLASRIMAGSERLSDETGHAIAYHNIDVQPAWSETMERTAQVGNHIFYKFMPRSALVPAMIEETPVGGALMPDGTIVPIADLPVLPPDDTLTPIKASLSQEIQPDVQTRGAVGDGA